MLLSVRDLHRCTKPWIWFPATQILELQEFSHTYYIVNIFALLITIFLGFITDQCTGNYNGCWARICYSAQYNWQTAFWPGIINPTKHAILCACLCVVYICMSLVVCTCWGQIKSNYPLLYFIETSVTESGLRLVGQQATAVLVRPITVLVLGVWMAKSILLTWRLEPELIRSWYFNSKHC